MEWDLLFREVNIGFVVLMKKSSDHFCRQAGALLPVDSFFDNDNSTAFSKFTWADYQAEMDEINSFNYRVLQRMEAAPKPLPVGPFVGPEEDRSNTVGHPDNLAPSNLRACTDMSNSECVKHLTIYGLTSEKFLLLAQFTRKHEKKITSPHQTYGRARTWRIRSA